MENDIKIFEFEKHEVETIFLDGEPLFNPYDVGKCLEISDSTIQSHLAKMNQNQKVILKIQDMDFLPESSKRDLSRRGAAFLKDSGLYKLIFKSRAEKAEIFQDWITDEVLPELRKTGSYQIEGSQERLINNLVANTEALLGVKREELAIFQAESWNKKLSNLMIDCARHGLGSMKELYEELYYVFSAETGIDIVEIAGLKGMKTREYLKENQSVAKTVYEFAHQHFTRPDRQVILVPSQTTLDGMI